MSGEALDTIQDIALNGEKDSDRLKAAQDILNRAGMKQAQEINVRHETSNSPSDDLMERLNSLAAHNQETPPEILDAEVITYDD